MARIVKREVTRGKKYEVRWSWYQDAATPDAQPTRRFAQERFATLEEAKAKKAEVEQRAVDRSLHDPSGGKETFGVWAERWFRDHSIGLKPSTARSYRNLLDASVVPAFGHRRIRSLTTADIQDWVAGLLDRGLAPPTIRHHYLTARHVLTYATHSRAIAYNPALDVRLPTDKSTGRVKQEMVCLDDSQVADLAAALSPPYDLLIVFMCYTGLRCAEVSGLRVGDLDLTNRRVYVRRTVRQVTGAWETHVPKNGKARVVGLPPWLASDLRAYLLAHPRSGDLEAGLWPGREHGGQTRFGGSTGELCWDKPWSRESFYRRQFKPALAAAGLPARMRLHDTRHTAGSLMLRSGIDYYRVADYLGHSVDVLLKIYSHILDADRDADMSKLVRPIRSTSS